MCDIHTVHHIMIDMLLWCTNNHCDNRYGIIMVIHIHHVSVIVKPTCCPPGTKKGYRLLIRYGLSLNNTCGLQGGFKKTAMALKIFHQVGLCMAMLDGFKPPKTPW